MTEDALSGIRRYTIETNTSKFPFEEGETIYRYACRLANVDAARKVGQTISIARASIFHQGIDCTSMGSPVEYVDVGDDRVEIEVVEGWKY